MNSDAKKSGNGGGGFRTKMEYYLYSGEKKHVFAGIAIFGVIFGVPWYLMTRGELCIFLGFYIFVPFWLVMTCWLCINLCLLMRYLCEFWPFIALLFLYMLTILLWFLAWFRYLLCDNWKYSWEFWFLTIMSENQKINQEIILRFLEKENAIRGSVDTGLLM